MKKPVTLIIMDGYGLAPAGEGNAISQAKKPNLDKMFNGSHFTNVLLILYL